MKELFTFGSLFIALTGCTVTDRDQVYYTQSEVNAITAEMQCRNMARNLLQIARCEVRR